MLADPPAHKWKRLTNADLGRPGCTTYHVRPRAGPARDADGLVGGEDLGRLSVTEPERPKAPWHPFPLVELCVLAGIVLLVLGLINFDTERGRAMLVSGMLLGSLGGLDTALREHFSGYRSHTTILAGLAAVALAAVALLRRRAVAGGRRRRRSSPSRSASGCSRAPTAPCG